VLKHGFGSAENAIKSNACASIGACPARRKILRKYKKCQGPISFVPKKALKIDGL
jgi:hypothetical protein